MRILRVDARDRERADAALANQVRAFLLAVGKWVEGHGWTLLWSEMTRQWSLDIEGEPVLTDVSLAEIAEAMQDLRQLSVCPSELERTVSGPALLGFLFPQFCKGVCHALDKSQ